jgi:hypothetical protein
MPKQIWKICHFVYWCMEAVICNIRRWMQAHIYNSSKLCLISARVGGYQSDSSALGKGKFCISFLFLLCMVSWRLMHNKFRSKENINTQYIQLSNQNLIHNCSIFKIFNCNSSSCYKVQMDNPMSQVLSAGCPVVTCATLPLSRINRIYNVIAMTNSMIGIHCTISM